MSKYIDAEKLKYEIERRNLSNYHTTTEGYEEELYEIIDSLEQEQPEMDLVQAIDEYFGDGGQWKSGFCVGEKGFLNIARHFYELGKNSK